MEGQVSQLFYILSIFLRNTIKHKTWNLTYSDNSGGFESAINTQFTAIVRRMKISKYLWKKKW